jgi:CubicO group peptidase (beta-lactamase class C family)
VGVRIHALTCLLTGLLVCAVGQAASLERAAPASVGMSKEGLAEMAAMMRSMVNEGELSGAITAVARKGKLVHWQAYGYQDSERGVPLTDDTIFRIYSMTKPVIGVALMTLFEEGKFELDDPVEKYIPQFEGLKVAQADGPDGVPVTVAANHPMTIRELVSHTGGLSYGIFSRSQVDTMYLKANVFDRDQTLQAFIDKMSKIPLKSQPGTVWEYSLSVDVQGYLIQVLAGKPLEKVLAERIFGPLGMPDTAFWVPPEKADRLATLYARGRDGQVKAQPIGEYLTEPNFPSGGGGLASTAMDYLRFSQMLANGGELDGVRILTPETVRLMHSNQLPATIEQIHPRVGNPGNEFGVDFALVTRPDGTTDHLLARSEFWWYGIGGTWFGVNPVQELVVIGMIQLRGGGAARKARIESKKLVYSAILDPN